MSVFALKIRTDSKFSRFGIIGIDRRCFLIRTYCFPLPSEVNCGIPIRLNKNTDTNTNSQIHIGHIRRHYFLPIAEVGDRMRIRLDEIQPQIQIHKTKFTNTHWRHQKSAVECLLSWIGPASRASRFNHMNIPPLTSSSQLYPILLKDRRIIIIMTKS